MNPSPPVREPANGRLLQWLALVHAAVGAGLFRSELRAIARDGVVAAVPIRGPKATAFWFLVPSPPLWIVGRLLRDAEAAGDHRALRRTSRYGLASSLICIVCMPISGFWAWLLISVRGLRTARVMRS